jgi:uncharacterized protein (TIGR00255 family)
MTGFGRGECSNEEYRITVEIKSVNNRYKDFRFKMSSLFNSVERDFRTSLLKRFKRGSFDIYINYKKLSKNSKFDDLDMEKIESFLALFSGKDIKVTPTDFMRSEFYKDEDLSKNVDLLSLGKEALELAAADIQKSRDLEGAKMREVISIHIESYKEHFSKIAPLSKTIESDMRDKLKKKFNEFSDIKLDEPRFLQEVVYYLEKLDVDEEINRIHAHLSKLDKLISGSGEIGRQIDFLVQELNRETNTIGSKSSQEEISNNVVQMKVQLEKIREQGLNLE